MDYDKTWWMSCLGDENKPIRFWCVTRTNGPDADPADQRDTKSKLFSLAEVCALPSAVLVTSATEGEVLHILFLLFSHYHLT